MGPPPSADPMTLSGFTGPGCEVNTDDCAKHQCQNGGTCQDGLGTYTCLCPEAWTGESFKPRSWHQWPGWSPPGLPSSRRPQLQPLSPSHPPAGWDCSKDVDECEAQGAPHCRNGGTCQNLAGSFHCVCVSGWGGIACEENLDDCVAATCAPGSTCIDRVGSFSCLCPPGRTGVGQRLQGGGRWRWRVRDVGEQLAASPTCPAGLLCHMEDMCLSQPCHGEAQCSTNPLTGATLCLCQPGYSGPTCHQDLDECQMGEAPPHQILSEPPDSLCTEHRQIVFQIKNTNNSLP